MKQKETILDFFNSFLLKHPFSYIRRLDLEEMVCFILSIENAELYSNPTEMTTSQQTLLNSMVTRRDNGEPLAYILGKKGFWDFDLNVNNNVLVPRPETETLVESVLCSLKKQYIRVLELGTGSGAIALSLSKERSNWEVFASDISEDALKVAKKNQEKFNHPVNFVQANWLEPFDNNCFDLVVSNPPYIDENDKLLKSDGLIFEPKIALVSKKKGFKDLKDIIATSHRTLKRGGSLFLEHAPLQSSSIRTEFQNEGFKDIKVFKDLNRDYRVSSAVKV